MCYASEKLIEFCELVLTNTDNKVKTKTERKQEFLNYFKKFCGKTGVREYYGTIQLNNTLENDERGKGWEAVTTKQVLDYIKFCLLQSQRQ